MSKATPHAPAHDKKDFGSSKMQQRVRSIPQSNLRKKTTPRCNQSPRYESTMDLMVNVIYVLTLVIKLWIVDSMEEEVLEAPMTKLDAGHVTKLDILLLLVTH